MRLSVLLAAALSLFTTALPSAAAAATTADFIIQTGLAGNVAGSPTSATITGGINYATFFAGPGGGSSAVTDFNVFLLSTGQNYNAGNFFPFAGGVNAVLNLSSGTTGILDFLSPTRPSPLFSFDLTGLFTANGQGALPGGGVTMTRATTIENTTIDAGSPGTIAVTAAVPEPTTWAMMLLGFAAIGLSLRRSRRTGLTPQFA